MCLIFSNNYTEYKQVLFVIIKKTNKQNEQANLLYQGTPSIPFQAKLKKKTNLYIFAILIQLNKLIISEPSPPSTTYSS